MQAVKVLYLVGDLRFHMSCGLKTKTYNGHNIVKKISIMALKMVHIMVHRCSGILAIKKTEIMPFAATWMGVEIVILSEVSQTEKEKYHMISLMCRV